MSKVMSNGMPTANIAINKSRVKLYNKNAKVPTYYLQKGQEFQIELFNPTTDNILAVISLNSRKISQGGLVLRPGERVFLDRYLDVAKKFKFDTYEVANTSEVKKAIEENGDFKVEFYREDTPVYFPTYRPRIYYGPYYGPSDIIGGGTGIRYGSDNITPTNCSSSGTLNLEDNSCTTQAFNCCTDSLNEDVEIQPKITKLSAKKSKTVETGRVEMGSQSDQKMTTVNKDWQSYPFCTVEYKLLPLSQKVNTVQDIQVKRYCTACGAKLHKGDSFCGKCGKRA